MLPERAEDLSPHLIVSEKTPSAFVWHTFADGGVNVKNSLMYALSLKDNNVPVEMHIFPDGEHGLGLSSGDEKVNSYVSKWKELLLSWLEYIE